MEDNSTSDRGGIISAEQMLISIFSLLTNGLRLPDAATRTVCHRYFLFTTLGTGG
ncbi:hypothetical protein [Desulfosporosinus burensis]